MARIRYSSEMQKASTYSSREYLSQPFGFDLIGIGNPIVDVLAKASEIELTRLGLKKGAMTLIGAERTEQLYSQMKIQLKDCGGSVANTLMGVTSLGGNCGFIGKICNDTTGRFFKNALETSGIEFRTPPSYDGLPTARCLVFVTPDAQRTMQTCLGTSGDLSLADIDTDLIDRAAITYLEGYLLDTDSAKQLLIAAAISAKKSKRLVSLGLSDHLCVERHRKSFLEIISHHVDVIFANEIEITTLFEVEDLKKAIPKIPDYCELAIITMGARGALIITKTENISVPIKPVKDVIDTTGAGDLFAAGVLFGLSHNYDLYTCGLLGSIAAAEVITHYGAHPQTSLELVARTKLRQIKQ